LPRPVTKTVKNDKPVKKQGGTNQAQGVLTGYLSSLANKLQNNEADEMQGSSQFVKLEQQFSHLVEQTGI